MLRVLAQVEVAAIRDAFQFGPADREEVLDVARPARVVRELVRIVRTDAQVRLAQPEVEIPPSPRVDPELEPLLRFRRRDEELHLHLLELARAEEEVPRRDLVAEALADLRDPERRLDAHRRRDVLEVDEDPLRGLGPEVGARRVFAHRPDVRLEHQVELARVRQVAVRCLTRLLRRLAPARRVLELVGAEAQLARAAVDHRIGEAADVAGRLPHLGFEDHRRVEQHDVLTLLHERAHPLVLDVVVQQDAVVAVVVRGAETAVDVRRREDERAPARERGDLVDRRGSLVGLGHPREATRSGRPAGLLPSMRRLLVAIAAAALLAAPAAAAATAGQVRAAFAAAGLPLHATTSGHGTATALATSRTARRGYDVLVFVFRHRAAALALVQKQAVEWRTTSARVELRGNVVVLVFPAGARAGTGRPATPTPPRVARALARLG